MNIVRTLRRGITELIGLVLRITGFVRRTKKKAFSQHYITSIYFHKPHNDLFEKCIKWLLKNGYSFISSEHLIELLNDKKKPEQGLIWLSFDDGWKDNMENVIPVLEKYKIPATFFISTGAVENEGVFWWEYVYKFRKYLPKKYKENVKLLWKVDENERKKVLSDLIDIISYPLKRSAMTIDDIKYISRFAEIGSHTVNHVITSNCLPLELEKEIHDSQNTLNQWIGNSIKLFSYPEGIFSERDKEILQKYGFRLAANSQNNYVSVDTDPFLVPRFCINDDAAFSEAICQMVGIWRPFVEKLKTFILPYKTCSFRISQYL